MPIQIGQVLQSVGLPENDMALLTATGNLFVFDRVYEAIDAFLMQVESSLCLVFELLYIVHVDEPVERRSQKRIEVFIVLDLCDPTPVRVHFFAFKTLLFASILSRPLSHSCYSLAFFTACFLVFIFITSVFVSSCTVTSPSTRICSSALPSCASHIVSACLLLLHLLFKLVFKSKCVFEGIMLPLACVVLTRDVLPMTVKVVTVLLIVVLILANVPIGLVEVVHGNNA